MAVLTFPVSRQPTPPYELGLEDNLLRSPTDGGYVITRSKYTRARTTTMKFRWQYMTDAEYTSLTDFYRTTTVNGSLSFKFNFATASLTKQYTVQFAAPPKTNYVGMGLWEVECNFMEI